MELLIFRVLIRQTLFHLEFWSSPGNAWVISVMVHSQWKRPKILLSVGLGYSAHLCTISWKAFTSRSWYQTSSCPVWTHHNTSTCTSAKLLKTWFRISVLWFIFDLDIYYSRRASQSFFWIWLLFFFLHITINPQVMSLHRSCLSVRCPYPISLFLWGKNGQTNGVLVE